jgi:hypothetical protein
MFKITTTFEFMKKGRNLFVYTILLLSVFFCSQITAHSTAETQLSYQELSEVSKNIEGSVCPDTEPSDEDQIDQSFKKYISRQPESQITYLFIVPLFDNLFPSVWQPPKIF